MKHEWKKHDKGFYLPKESPELVEIPKFKFFTIEGQGNPNNEAFAEEVGALYSLAYGVKMLPKKGITPEGYYEYTIFPLEGIWDLTEVGRQSAALDKDELVYKIMIRQPDFVSEALAEEIINAVNKKKPSPLYARVRFEELEDGLSVQMLHTGSYDDEPRSFEKMKDFCRVNNLIREDLRHREIYISDVRKTAPEKLKTTLRYFVKRSQGK